MNTEQKHTPGPFRITGPGFYRTRVGSRVKITARSKFRIWSGDLAGEPGHEWKENGRFWYDELESDADLVAPWPDSPSLKDELLDALDSCAALLDAMPNFYVSKETGSKIEYSPDGALAKARAAIAKARGEA